MIDVSNWLYRLLARNKCNYKYKEEAFNQVIFADHLRVLSLEKKLKCIWFATCNELGKVEENTHRGSYLQALGKIAGTPDMSFMWKDGSGFIEFKSKKGCQSESQKLFQRWCETIGVNYRIARSYREALEILKEWKILD